MKIEVVLGNNGREFRGRRDQHLYGLFLQLEDIELRTTRVKRPHRGRGMNGRTPVTIFKAGLPKPPPRKKEKAPPQKLDGQLAA